MPNTFTSFGERLKAQRKRLNMTEKELAERTSINHRSLENHEQGRRQVSVQDLLAKCVALKIEPTHILLWLKSAAQKAE